jgi:hypothetical protein
MYIGPIDFYGRCYSPCACVRTAQTELSQKLCLSGKLCYCSMESNDDRENGDKSRDIVASPMVVVAGTARTSVGNILVAIESAIHELIRRDCTAQCLIEPVLACRVSQW